MIEAEILLPTADGTMSAFTTQPDEGGPFPAVFFYMDAPGKREELHDMARRIATTGYHVVLPNLYYRTTPDFVLDFEGDSNRDEMYELMYGLSNRMVIDDTAALFAHIDAHPDVVSDGPVGCLGYCMSGPFALSVAAAFPDRIRAAASLYGVRLAVDADDSPHRAFGAVTGELYIACAETDSYAPPEMVAEVEAAIVSSGVNGRDRIRAAASLYGVRLAVDADDSPHRAFGAVTGEIYIACAETDSYAPPEMVAEVEAAIVSSGVNGRVEWYPGTHHGFAFPTRGSVFDKAAAETHWSRLHALFDRNLRNR